MPDRQPEYCYVCGRGVNTLNPDDDQNLETIHIFEKPPISKNVNQRKTRKRRIGTQVTRANKLESIIDSDEVISNEGVWLEKITARKLEFISSYNYICHYCVIKVHHYKELSEEIEKIRNEIVEECELQSKARRIAGDEKLPKCKLRISKRKKDTNYGKRNKMSKESQEKGIETIDNPPKSEKDSKDINKNLFDETNSTTNNNISISSRRSVRLKTSDEKIHLKESEEITNFDDVKEQSNTVEGTKNDKETISLKNSSPLPLSKSEYVESERCNESKQQQLKQTSIIDKSNSHPCEICGKSFLQRHLLVEHLKAHTHEKPFSCDKCHKSFKARHSLREHVLRYHDKVQKWICNHPVTNDSTSEDNICNQRFSSRHLLMRHRMLHDSTLRFSCEVCKHEFATRRGLQLHSSLHTGKYPFTCSECGRGFSTKTLLQEHSIIHTGEKPISCDKCDKKFANRGTYWSHRKIHEHGNRPYVCEICSKSYNHGSHLAAHKRKHTGERPYVCWLCSKEFALASHLKRHMGTHDGNPNPFCCLICSKSHYSDQGDSQHEFVTFNKRVELVSHYQKCHPGETIQNKSQTPANIENQANKNEITNNHNTIIRLPSLFDTSIGYTVSSEKNVPKTDAASHISGKPSHLAASLTLHNSQEKRLIDSNVYLSQYTCGFCHVGFQDTNNLENHVIMKHSGETIYNSHRPFHESPEISTVQVSSILPPCHIPKQDEISIYQQLNSGSKQNETLLIVMPDTFSQQ